ncbi:MAG: NADH dehydrogenase subunit, partial [Candidatus Bathyarchaeia archaeon]
IGRVMGDVEKAVRYIHSVLHEKTAEKRLLGVGVLPRDDALRLCAVGPVARGSGVKVDIRWDDPYAAYADLRKDFSVVVRSDGDVMSRAEVRVLETLESAHIVKAILERLPNGPISQPGNILALMRKIPVGETVSRVEAPRGELIHYVRTNGNSGVERLKIRSPTLANLATLKTMLVGSEIADVPVIVASIDPCISCAERLTVVNAYTNESNIVDAWELRRRRT